MRQWMGYIVFTPSVGAYSSSYFWSATVRGQYSYAGGQGGNVEGYLRTNKWPIRCVREMPFDNISVKVAPTAYVYTDERDNKYAAINASDQIRRIEERNENPDFWKTGIGLYHYIQGGINPEPVKDKDGTHVLVTRPARSGTQGVNRTVSSHFVVASSDIDNTTVTPNNKAFNWATASGYLETANTTSYNEEASATNHGCASYRGKDNKDSEGTWRLPLVREAVLIMMYENFFRDTSSETGFENLGSGINYWTASENMATQSWQFYSMLQSNVSTQWKVDPVGGWKVGIMRARCIKDISPTP